MIKIFKILKVSFAGRLWSRSDCSPSWKRIAYSAWPIELLPAPLEAWPDRW